MSKSKILMTGATGFVGQAFIKDDIAKNFELKAAVRRSSPVLPTQVRQVPIGDILPDTDWSADLSGIDAVIHLAARVHVMHDTVSNSLTEFRKVNRDSTINLARQASEAGVRRFIFLSSVKVNGEQTQQGHSFTEVDQYVPTDPYSLSKFEAELGLRNIAAQSEMEVVIIRPPLVYGPGVKANFLSMMKWLTSGIPLPFGNINNMRSLLAVGNLIDLIVICLNHPDAANQTFLASDGEDLSTTQLLQNTGVALGTPVHLVRIPVPIIEVVGKLLGRRNLVSRLCGSLQVDISKARKVLGWTPPITIENGLKITAEWYLKHLKKD